MSEFLKSEAFILYGIPLLIALARITDVSIGTLRIIFIAKGLKLMFVKFILMLMVFIQHILELNQKLKN